MAGRKTQPFVFPLVSFLGVLFLVACPSGWARKEAPKAIQGVLDLTQWDFAQDGPVQLSGEWEFYWKRHLRPADFSQKDPPELTGFIRVPGIWNGYTVGGEKIAGDGYATYRLQVLLGSSGERLALKFLDVATAFAVYVNGHKLLSSGVPGTTRQTTRPQFYPQVVDFQPVSAHIDIVILVSNFHHRKGGAWEAIRFGAVADLRASRERAVSLGIFLFGSILIMGLYHLGLFVLRRKEKSPLYFGVFCLLMMVRILTTGERYLVQLFPDFPWDILTKMAYLSYYLAIPVFAMFFRTLFVHELSKKALYIIALVTLPFSGVVLGTPAQVYSHTVQAFQILTVLIFLYGIYLLVHAAIQKREGALIFLTGFLVLFATTLNDILYANLLIYTTYLSPIGLFTFIFSQAFLLSHRFSKAFAIVEDQRQELTQTNRAYAQEISERQRIEAALRQSESALAEAQRIAHIGNWEWDVTTGRVVWSEEVFRIFGLSPCELSYERVRSLVHAPDTESWERAVRAALADDTPLRLDYRMQKPDGTMCWVHSEAKVLRNAEGHPVKMFGTFQDITERKKMEEELLTASKLESIGVLAGGIAHDFNNILAAILSSVSLAKREIEPRSKAYQRLQDMEKAGAQATALTQQLLTFSKGGAPVRRMAAISELIKETALFALRGSNVRGDFTLPEGLWPAEVDVGQINRVIHNLILNGAQAMPEGGIIAVRGENVIVEAASGLPLQPGSYLKISFQDHGIGIPEEHLSKIFDPYFTTKPRGSGLGLATAYSIIKRHDGHIAVDSQRGVGTTFHVYLPAAPQGRPPLSENATGLHMGTGRVLVMDDEEKIRELAQQMLHYLGYEAEVAQDGAEAMARYQQARAAGNPFAVVILDLTVPGGMGGKDTLQRLLAIDPEVRAIVSSGYYNDPVMSAFKTYGFSEVVAKPYSLEELSKAVHNAIKARQWQTPGNT
jgi:PAS domain S-box-containing protein